MIFFLDASALTKLYMADRGSSKVRGLVRRRAELAAAPLYTSVERSPSPAAAETSTGLQVTKRGSDVRIDPEISFRR